MKTIINSQGCNSIPGKVELEVGGDINVSGRILCNGVELRNTDAAELEKRITTKIMTDLESRDLKDEIDSLEDQVKNLTKKLEALEKLVTKLSQPSSKKDKTDKQEQQ